MKLLLIGDVHRKMDQYLALLDTFSTCFASIQLGDFGYNFLGVPSNIGEKNKFIRGNHDDPAKCVAHSGYLGDYGTLLDGEIFYLSGAFSIDWQMRVEGISWWRGEELSWNALQDAVDMYKKVKPRIVLTHECPAEASKILLGGLLGPYFAQKGECRQSRTAQALQVMLDSHQPEKWFFGHYHVAREFQIPNVGTKFRCLAELEPCVIDI